MSKIDKRQQWPISHVNIKSNHSKISSDAPYDWAQENDFIESVLQDSLKSDAATGIIKSLGQTARELIREQSRKNTDRALELNEIIEEKVAAKQQSDGSCNQNNPLGGSL